jgi:ubiquinone/menaquinone biosynthesis C-methylase UbiE
MSVSKLVNMPHIDRQREYFDTIAQVYDRYNFRTQTYEWMCHEILNVLEEFRTRTGKGKIDLLDCATGTGDVLAELAVVQEFNRLVGIDISSGMLRQAEKRLHDAGQEAELVCGDLNNMPFASNSLDVFVFKLAFHHLELPWRVMEETTRVIRSPGLIIIADVLSPENVVADEFFYALNRMREPANFRYRPLSVLRFWLQHYGFKEIGIAQTSITLALEAWLKEPTYFEADKTVEWVVSAPAQIKEIFNLRYDSTFKTHLLDFNVAVLSAQLD